LKLKIYEAVQKPILYRLKITDTMDASTAGCIKKANYKVCDIDIMKMVPGLGIEPRTRGFSII
jgi:hypothetical protein